MRSIFEEEFYPTPKEVIDRMMMGENVAGKIVLEPSAGSGNIVEWLKANGVKEVLACEINADLQKIVSRKCRLIGDDFLKLTAEEISHIDMIVMNPPFSTAATHILHAYEIAPSGCQVIAICNSNTLKDRYTTERKRLQDVIELNGYAESLGQCFKDSERPTDVCVSLVKLYKPGEGNHEFDGYLFSEEEEEEFAGNAPGLMPYNVIRDLVNRYVMAVSKFDEVMKASEEINGMMSLIGGCSIKFGAYRDISNFQTKITRDIFKKQLQKESWSFLFKKLDMGRFVTSKVKETINKFIERQENVPFTMRNIYIMLDMIVKTQRNRMNQSLEEAFDLICSFSAENSTAGEKWKTNANYMINKKFIVHGICRYDGKWTPHVVNNYGWNLNKIQDLVTALNYISGNQYNQSLFTFIRESNIPWGEWAEWGYFRIKGFKKGTMHFEFLDESVWMEFNRRVAKIKGWSLPKKSEKASRKRKSA